MSSPRRPSSLDATPKPDPRGQAAMLAQILRAIRLERRLRTSDVARAMGMPLRSYEHFEAGRGRLDLQRLQQFGDATDSDPFAIVVALILRRPDFALRCADNKLMVVMMLSLDDFNEDLAEDIRLIEAGVLVGAFRRVFQDLTDHVRKRDLTAERWLDDRSRRMGLPFFAKGRPRRL